jgi:multicomponent Na+:H+ antiporter subunit B
MILVRLVRGAETPWGLGRNGALACACGGVLLYGAIGLFSLVRGGNYLDYGVIPVRLDPGHVRAVGSFGIELGVALAVTGVMVLIFDSLIGRGQEG